MVVLVRGTWQRRCYGGQYLAFLIVLLVTYAEGSIL